MRLTEHPLWDDLLPYLYVQHGEGVNGPRHRMEVREPLPEELRAIEIHCVFDDRPIKAIRRRAGWGKLFLSVSCPLYISWRCARQPVTTRECDRLRALIAGAPTDRRLF